MGPAPTIHDGMFRIVAHNTGPHNVSRGVPVHPPGLSVFQWFGERRDLGSHDTKQFGGDLESVPQRGFYICTDVKGKTWPRNTQSVFLRRQIDLVVLLGEH